MAQWQDVEPSMMYDKENMGDDQTLKRKRPDWRSPSFNSFMDELDQRAYHTSKHPRKMRVLGTPLKCPYPERVKQWMLNESEECDDQRRSPELC